MGGNDETPAEAAVRIGGAVKRVNRLVVDVEQQQLQSVAEDSISHAVMLHLAFHQHKLHRIARPIHRPVKKQLGHLAHRVKLAGAKITLALHIQPLILSFQTPVVFIRILESFHTKGEKSLRIGRGGGNRAVLRVVVVLALLQLHLLPCHGLARHIIDHIAVHTVIGRCHQHKRPCRHIERLRTETPAGKVLSGRGHQYVMSRGKGWDVTIMTVWLVVLGQHKWLFP